MDQLFDYVSKFPNVTGCFVGRRSEDGRLTREPGLICCVRQKVKRRELDKNRELLPRFLKVPIGGTVLNLRTDVIEMPPLSVKVAPVAGPGDGIETSVERATIGVALDHPRYGPVVTTAGHLIYTSGQTGIQEFDAAKAPRVTLANSNGGAAFAGRVLKVAVNDRADYAIAQLDGAPHENFYSDKLRLVGIHTPSDSDLEGRRLFVLAKNGAKQTRFLGYRAVMHVGNAGVMHNLIITELATIGGDSGACLIDDSWNVWGLLCGGSVSGGAAYSVFTSVFVPLVMESALLA